ncbi:MAG TPA: DUF2264 domain-containing protein [Steroidobacteraceae bacterium]
MVIVIMLYAYALHHFSAAGWGHFFPASTQDGAAELAVKREFQPQPQANERPYRALFQYFLSGVVRFTDAIGSRIHYPGAPSIGGYQGTGLEGFARTGTLLAAWVASGRSTVLQDQDSGTSIDLIAYLRRGLLAGTNPRSKGYWGRFGSWDQRIVETADVARIVWLTRDQIWLNLTPAQQLQITAWLRQDEGAQMPANVWLLSPVTVRVVLHALGVPGVSADANSDDNYQRFKRNYVGNGWFSDPPEGVDFYNTWGMSYELFWISYIDPQFDHDFIRSSLNQSADLTAHLIGTDGVPIMGRSICYRTAVPVPLLAANLLDDQSMQSGMARHGLDLIWRYFVSNGALQDGALTQGYRGADLRFLDYYSGPGSCQWGLRSLVLAMLHGPESEFWQSPEQQLPVERGDYRMVYDKLGWIVSGRQADGSVTIEIPRNAGHSPQPRPYSWWRSWLEPIFRRPFRPPQQDTEYNRAVYSSALPMVGDGD